MSSNSPPRPPAGDDTDLGMSEPLSEFVRRHGGIDATLEYMRRINHQSSGMSAMKGIL